MSFKAWTRLTEFERMYSPKELLEHTGEIENAIGYRFKDKNLLLLAFTHRSFVNENRLVNEHNERLEFLGDAIFGLLVSEHLYRNFPQTPEGELSFLRSRLVEASSCVTYIQKLDVEKYLLLGKGERLNNGRGRDSILSDLFEAIIGAIYLDDGIEAARSFLFGNFSKMIADIVRTPIHNWKALLQDYCQKKFQKPPLYKVMSESGPDHQKSFTISVIINDEELGIGKGTSKKIAQQQAAEDALSKLPWQKQ